MELDFEAIDAEHPEYQDSAARNAVAARQGLAGLLLFPTLGCGVEEGLKHDVPATMASLTAFNKWLEEDWVFHNDRLVAAPMLSLADPDAALVELDSLLERGARNHPHPSGARARRARQHALAR